MPLDLTTVNDHPVSLIEGEKEKGLTATVDALVAAQPAEGVAALTLGMAYAAEVLRTYEKDHGVVFAALDEGALADVRDAYEALYHPSGQIRDLAFHPIAKALDALLGLDSGE